MRRQRPRQNKFVYRGQNPYKQMLNYYSPKLTYTLAGDSSPVTPLGARPRNPN